MVETQDTFIRDLFLCYSNNCSSTTHFLYGKPKVQFQTKSFWCLQNVQDFMHKYKWLRSLLGVNSIWDNRLKGRNGILCLGFRKNLLFSKPPIIWKEIFKCQRFEAEHFTSSPRRLLFAYKSWNSWKDIKVKHSLQKIIRNNFCKNFVSS
jgi:hypothetical protein